MEDKTLTKKQIKNWRMIVRIELGPDAEEQMTDQEIQNLRDMLQQHVDDEVVGG
jgi:hypothetical protein